MFGDTYYGTMWELVMSPQDLLNYYLYILLLISSPVKVSCDNFLEY